MSLLEDIFDLLQNVLEYFGVSPDMLIPVWESQLCGQYRSLVRMIGTNLPLTPSPRIHFQIPLHTSRQHRYLDVTMDTLPAIPSLADVLWVAEDEGDSFTKIRSPGGTPVRRRRSKGAALLSDPASMIAEALRRKFAHRRLDDSYDKENRSVELSPFGSPDTSPCRLSQAVRRDSPRLLGETVPGC
uniref:Mitochondrial fission regulator n=1 Tax=Oncorhynchus mykiss TaxID=8022 RepID=A0A8C7S468_ONCMY